MTINESLLPAFGWDGHAASSEEDEGTDGEVCLAKQKKGGEGENSRCFSEQESHVTCMQMFL